jgi:hypothetical protein
MGGPFPETMAGVVPTRFTLLPDAFGTLVTVGRSSGDCLVRGSGCVAGTLGQVARIAAGAPGGRDADVAGALGPGHIVVIS